MDKSVMVDMIYKSNGQHLVCSFVKKDGSFRTLYGCLRPKENSKGLRYSPKDKGLICIYDLENDGYRMINIDGLMDLKLLDEPFEAIA